MDEGSLRSAVWQAIVNNDVTELAGILNDAARNNTPIDVNGFVLYVYGQKMLHRAVYEGSHDIVCYLLETCNASVDVRDNERRTPLMKAAEHGRMEALKCLLHHGAEINATSSDGKTAMHYAAMDERNEIINFLLDNRDQFLPDLNLQDRYGKTPFHWACRLCSASIIAQMLHCGAHLHLQDSKGSTALHYAASNQDHPEAIEILLISGLNVNARDYRGDSPLHWARSVENACLLIDRGANLDARNNKAETPEESIDKQNVRYFVGLVRTFRETRQRWYSVFGLDRNKTDQDRANQEELDSNSQEVEESATAVKTYLFPKAVHQLLCQPGNVREEVRMGFANVAFLGLRKNGPQVMEAHYGGNQKNAVNEKVR